MWWMSRFLEEEPDIKYLGTLKAIQKQEKEAWNALSGTLKLPQRSNHDSYSCFFSQGLISFQLLSIATSNCAH